CIKADACACFFGDDWEPELAPQSLKGPESTAKIPIAFFLDELHGGVHMKAERVGAEAREGVANDLRLELARLDDAEVPQKRQGGSDIAYLISRSERRIAEEGALAPEAKGIATLFGDARKSSVDLTRAFMPTRHSGDENRGAQLLP